MKRLLLITSIITALFSLSFKVEAQTQTVVNGSPTTVVNFPGTGCIYNWVNDTPGIGLAASGTGNIPSFTAVNAGNIPVTATITASPMSVGYAYIPNVGDGTVSVINITTNSIVSTITVGQNPKGLSVSPDGSRVYVINLAAGTVSVINTATDAVISTIQVGIHPQGVSISPDGGHVYVANSNSNNISVINTATNTVLTTIATGLGPIGVTVSPDGSKVYVVNNLAGTVSVINTATNSVGATITVDSNPIGVSVSPDGSRVYVTNFNSNTVSVINTATNTVIATIAVGSFPDGVSVSPDGSRAYVTNYQSDNVSVINTATNLVVSIIAVGVNPAGVSVSPDGNRVYVTNSNTNNVSVINTSTNAVVLTIAVGSGPVSYGNFITRGSGCPGIPVNFTITVNPTSAPGIIAGPATGSISACEGTASASPNIEQFIVSGSSLTSDITVNAPNNFEVSLSPGTGYAKSVTLVQAGGTVNNTVVYVRSSALALAGLISGNVTLISGMINRKVPVTGTVNASLTINPVPNQGPYLNGSTTQAINFTGNGNTFNWFNDTPGIGLAASGSGNIAPFTAVNNSPIPVIATVTVNPASLGFAYIANSISNNVSVIKTATNTVVTTIPVGQTPTGVAVSPDGSRVYVPNQRSNTVSVITTATNTVTATITIADFGPTNVAVSPDGTRLYVVNLNSNDVSVINTATNALIATVGVGGYPAGVAVSPDNNWVYIANSSNSISVIDATTNTIKTTIPVGKSPYGIAVSPDGSTVYVALSGANSVIVISTATDQVISTIPVGSNPAGVAVSPDGSQVYVSNANDATVSVINTSTDNVVSTIPVGSNPIGVSVSPDYGYVYVVNENSNSVSIINTATNAVTGTVSVGAFPVSLGKFVTAGTGCTGPPVKFTITVNPFVLPAVITALGSPAPLITVYGTASASTSFSISGTNMTAGILVSPPAGFEVSTDNVTFSRTLTIGTSGAIVSTMVYIRLASSTPVGNYSGNIALTSAGASNVNVVMPLSRVTPAHLTITAHDTSKIYGHVNPIFAVTDGGFVNGDGPAQLTAQPIVATTAVTTSPAGQYTITVRGAKSPNYIITQVPGILTIVPAPQMVTIPNTFTPNGDGINDTWNIKYLNTYPNCTVEIYNRYGENVYSSIGYGVPWDGTYKGSALPTSTYYYIINLKNGSEVLSGFVAIIK